MTLYQTVLEQAAAAREARITNRTQYRKARLAKFLASMESVRWRRQGHRVVWR